jgi:hypothetical protein
LRAHRSARVLVASRLSAVLALALLAVALIACSGAAGSPPTSPASSFPAASAPGPNATLGAVIDVEALLRDASATDGARVRVDGFFLATGDAAQLCSVVLESYPPQCGGATVRLTGEVPGAVLAGLERTQQPDLAPATWGWVIVTGTFHATGTDGRPTLVIEEIELHEG